jgi:hypothetical protein
MKIPVSFLLAIIFAVSSFAQTQPISRDEFVKMLNALQKAPATKAEIVAALRRRGIGFVLTDGMRSFARTKSANDDELKRALDEADRRRADPVATKLPSAAEAKEILEKATFNTRQAIGEMPDFVVKQLITRSEAFAGTGNWRPYDSLVIAVSYSDEKGEQYRLMARNGAPVLDATTQSSYSGLDGATSGGEFVEDLKKIFDPVSRTRFDLLTTDAVRGRRAVVFDYEIEIQNNKNGGVGLKGASYESAPAGEKGRIWIDRDSHRVLKIEYQLTDISPSFPVKAVTKSIDYDMIEISGEKYLLPTISDFRGTVAATDGRRYEQRNVIRFRNYQKFGSTVTIGDEEIVETETPEKKPS